MGRSKARRWADEDSDTERSPVNYPTSYLDAICQGSQLWMSSLLERVEPCCIVGGSRGSIAAGRGKRPLAEGARPATVAEGVCNSATSAVVVHGRRNCRSRRPWLRPHLVHGLPARPVEGRVPDADGWREVLSHGSVSGAGGARPARPASASQQPPTCYPADLHGKCFNCLSTAHRVATCKLPPGCFH
jgi:hypothetical protein